MNNTAKKNGVTVGLLGQPNTGKSTLFNSLTGSRQHVGNWPGKTVEQKSGKMERNGKTISIVDLPGTYSLTANSDEERVTRDFIHSGEADLIVALIDASKLERSMFLLADYAGIKTPVIAALNMVDVASQNGKEIDAAKLQEKLGIPVIPTVATKKEGISKLFESIPELADDLKSLGGESLFAGYERGFGKTFADTVALLPKEGMGADRKGQGSLWTVRVYTA